MGWRWVRHAVPLLALVIFWALLANDTTRTWLMEKYQHKIERRIERVVHGVPSLLPSPPPTRAPRR